MSLNHHKRKTLPPPQAFTAKANGCMSELITKVTVLPGKILNQQSKGIDVNAIWDTGATNSAVSKEVVIKLGLVPFRKTPVHGEKICNVYKVDYILPNQLRIINVDVTEGDLGNFGVLIGMDIIGLGDFAVTQADGNTCFSYRYPPLSSHIDFTEDINKARKRFNTNPSSSGGSSKRQKSRRKR